MRAGTITLRTGFCGEKMAGNMKIIAWTLPQFLFSMNPPLDPYSVCPELYRWFYLDSDIRVESDNEIVVEFSAGGGDAGPSGREVPAPALPDGLLKTFGAQALDMIKKIAPRFDELKKTKCKWLGCCETESLNELECTAALLAGIENPERIYGEKTVKELKGEKYDVFRIELESMRRKEIKDAFRQSTEEADRIWDKWNRLSRAAGNGVLSEKRKTSRLERLTKAKIAALNRIHEKRDALVSDINRKFDGLARGAAVS